MVPASTRRKAIENHGRGKVHALRLDVPCKEKRNADGDVTRKKARITAGDLVTFGKPQTRRGPRGPLNRAASLDGVARAGARPGPTNALMPDSILPRARSILGLGGSVL